MSVQQNAGVSAGASLSDQGAKVCPETWSVIVAYEHPVVLPQVSHFMQVPLRTSVKFPHSPQASPS